MGRKGSRLVPFIKEGLMYKKYINLKPENESIFSLTLPRKMSRLSEECQYILKDWYEEKGRNYVFVKHYTAAKQAIEAAFRQSDYLERVSVGDDTLTYRILTDEEVKAKKLVKKQKCKPKEDVYYSPKSVESGYCSGPGSPFITDFMDDGDALRNVNHDHNCYVAQEIECYTSPLPEEVAMVKEEEDLNEDTACFLEPVDIQCDVKENYFDASLEDDLALSSGSIFPSGSREGENEMFFSDSSTDFDLSFSAGNLYPTNHRSAETEKETETSMNALIDSIYDSEMDEWLEQLSGIPGLSESATEPELLYEFLIDDFVPNAESSVKLSEMYVCDKADYLGEMLMLVCEPKDLLVCSDIANPGKTKIMYNHRILEMVRSFPKLKCTKKINDTLLIFMEP